MTRPGLAEDDRADREPLRRWLRRRRAAWVIRVMVLPEKAISVGFHAASGTALLSTHAHGVCLVDTLAGKCVRSGATPILWLLSRCLHDGMRDSPSRR